MARRIRVATIFGGMSNEHEISLVSATNIIKNIPEDKFEVLCIGITKKGRWFYYPGDVELIKTGEWEQHPDLCPCVLSPDPAHKGFIKILNDGTTQIMKVDCVFPMLHGKNGEDGTIQGLFELSKLPYVGCDVMSSANCMDKETTHIILEASGVKMASFVSMKSAEIQKLDAKCAEMVEKLGFPMFIKPANCGSSVGVSKAENIEELKAGIKTAFAHDKKVIVEEFIRGRECECAVLGNDSPIASMVAEIVSCNEFYDYEAKYKSDDCEFYMPARIGEDVIEKVRETALKCYKAIGCSGLARIDFFVCGGGEICLNEINTLPGFTSISMYPQLMKFDGIDTPELVERLIKLAFERAEADYE